MNYTKPYEQKAYPNYNHTKKKFPLIFRQKLNEVEDKIAFNPWIGEEKTGDLTRIRVYKFRLFDQEILLAYEVDKNRKAVLFIAVGGHENFYKDLKRYSKL